MNIQKTLDSAIEQVQSGNLLQAEKLCRKILTQKPDSADALHFLGLIYYQRGQRESAISYIKKALQIDPDYADAYNNLGNIFQEANQLDRAMACYREALKLNPHSAKTYYNLGLCLQNTGHPERAIEYYEKALKLHLRTFGLLNNLGLALQDRGDLDQAMTCYENALELNPDFAEAQYNMGNAFRDKGELDEAIACYQKAIKLDPGYAEAYLHMGIVLKDKGQFDKAITQYQKAIALNPSFAKAYSNLGNSLRMKGNLDEAVICYQKAIDLNPSFVEAFCNLGLTFQEKGEIGEAMICYQKAIELSPDFADAHWNLSLALLLSGNFDAGWSKYEWRWKTKENTSRSYSFPKALWDGSSLNGKRIFVFAEQGIGDEIMFASCLPDVIAEAGLCIVACEKRLVPLFSRSFPECTITEHFCPDDTYPSSLSESDMKIAMGSIPKFLRRDLRSFPERQSYLVPDHHKVKTWKERYRLLGEGLNVGISWRGGLRPYEKLTRSTLLAQWAALFSLKGIHYINLQYGDCKNELREADEKLGVSIHDWEDSDPLKDLDDFAAQVAALDLVISIDNATVHMAGALGVPVWTLLPFACNWRWMSDGEHSPWYKTMRLFRQLSYGDWDEVFQRVCDALRETATLNIS
jgi:tetratricopeptide (TPR) repeat protein